MMEATAVKMYLAAKKLNELNSSGKVKAFNEKGYAKIVVLKRGCTVWMHHLKDDRLTIGLMVTVAAENAYPVTTNWAIKKFKEFAGDRVKLNIFKHQINHQDERSIYYIDVTSCSYEEIDLTIGQLLKLYGT